MTIPDILQALEAQQMIQQRNPPFSALWKEASENIHRLMKLLPPPEGLYCAYCRRSVDRDTERLEACGDGLWLHWHCAEDLRADGQLPDNSDGGAPGQTRKGKGGKRARSGAIPTVGAAPAAPAGTAGSKGKRGGQA